MVVVYIALAWNFGFFFIAFVVPPWPTGDRYVSIARTIHYPKWCNYF